MPVYQSLPKNQLNLRLEKSLFLPGVLYLKQVRQEGRLSPCVVGLNERKHFRSSRVTENAISRTKKRFNHRALVYPATRSI